MRDEALTALLDDIESDRVERKESVADGDKIRQAICAFANDLPDQVTDYASSSFHILKLLCS